MADGLNLKVTWTQQGPGFGGLAARLPAAIAAGLNEGGEQVRAQVQRALWKQTGAKSYASITRRVQVTKAGGAAVTGGGAVLAYSINVAGRPVMKLSEFNWKQTNRGVQANVWGVPHNFKRSFVLNGVPKARLGPERLPIRTLYGPNLAKELSRGATPAAFASAARAYIPPAILKHIRSAL